MNEKSFHEIIIPNDDLPFKMFVFEGKDGNYVREKHWHRSIEIFALFEGELSFHLHEEIRHLRPGEFVLVNSNEIHSVHSPKPNYTVVLQIPLQLFCKYYTDEQFIYFSHSTREQDAEIMRLLKDMYQCYTKKRTGYEFEVQGRFYQLLFLLVSNYRKTQVSGDMVRQSKGLGRLSVIAGYMKENYKKELSLEHVAELFGYSPTYLSRMFRKYAKTNYKSYLDSIRVEYAWKDLRLTGRPIGEIAMEHGFANSKSFAKAFQKKYHMLPSEYRRWLKG